LRTRHTPPQGTPEKVEQQANPKRGRNGGCFPALLRKLDRIDLSYRT